MVLQYGIWCDGNICRILLIPSVQRQAEGDLAAEDTTDRNRETTGDRMRDRHKDGCGGEVNWVGKTAENNLKLI